MSIQKIIKLLEDLVFEILSWFVYVPYTLGHSLIPGHAHEIVAEQYELEDPEDRYKNALSPILYYFVIALMVTVGDPRTIIWESVEEIGEFEFLAAALSILALPFIFTLPFWWWVSRNKKIPLQKTKLRRMFEVQALLWPILFLTYFLGFLLWGALDPSRETFVAVFTLVVLAGTLYFLFLEGWALQLDLTDNKPTIGSTALWGFLVSIVIYGVFQVARLLTNLNLFAPLERLFDNL